MEDRKEIKELLEWNEEQRKVIMDKLKLEPSDLDNFKLWGKWLKYYFSDEIFADYEVLKINLDDWLKNIDEDWTEDDTPFGINQAFLLKTYYDYVRRNRLMEFLVQNVKGGEAEKILRTTPGIGPDEITPRSYDERVTQIESARDMAQKIAKDSIGYLKWLISSSNKDIRKQAFEIYQTMQKWLLSFEMIKLCVAIVDTVNEPPKLFHFYERTRKDLMDFKDLFFGYVLKEYAELPEVDKTEYRSNLLEQRVRIFKKKLTRRDIEAAFKFFFDGKDDIKTMRHVYRYYYVYAFCSIFLAWRRLRATLIFSRKWCGAIEIN